MAEPTVKISFEKIHVCGNDFVLLENAPGNALASLCDRRHGIGADGVMVFNSADRDVVRLDHYDPDGSRSFCLNGIRASLDCLAKKGVIGGEGRVESEGVLLDYSITDTPCVALDKTTYRAMTWRDGAVKIPGFFIDVGNPHFVVVNNMDPASFRLTAPLIRNDLKSFAKGVNAHLVRPHENGWRIYSFERGVEDFTKACGSGMLAAGLALMGEGSVTSVTFFPEGRGMVRITDMGERVRVEGDARWIASGVWLLCGS